MSQLTIFITYGTIFYAGGSFIINDGLPFGSMMKAMMSILFAAFGIGQAQQYVGDLSKAKSAVISLYSVLNTKTAIDPLDENERLKHKPAQFNGKIEFRNVEFTYPTRPEQKVLKDVSFIIHPGQSAAFVGFSGSGKSTIIQLIERFYDASAGQILIDDMPIQDYNIIELRKNIGLVMQEPHLFKRSMVENIRYGKINGATDEQIVGAAKKAELEEIIAANGQKDNDLSGGQKQRVAIARAILKDPKILLLDEATSALDKTNEEKIQETLDKVMAEKTSVTVAHRLSTIEKCDVIYVLQAGQIVEVGNYHELIAKKDKFYSLARGQAQAH